MGNWNQENVTSSLSAEVKALSRPAALWKQICLLAFQTWCRQGAPDLFPLLISSHFWPGKYTKYKGGIIYHVFKMRDQEKKVFFFSSFQTFKCHTMHTERQCYTINLIYILQKSATNPFYFVVWIEYF